MKSLFKCIAVFLFTVFMGIFLSIGYGMIELPSEYRTVRGDYPKITDSFYSFHNTQKSDENTYDTSINVFKIFPVKRAKVKEAERRYLNVGGDVFGIRLYTKGVLVVGSDSISTNSGEINPAERAGLKKGDIILKINGEKVSRNNDISSSVKNSGGKEIELLIDRDETEKTIFLKPERSREDGEYKAGIWVRDSSAGIGTVTYYDSKNKLFAGLGHPVCDVDTGEILIISQGDAVAAGVKGCYRGKQGDAGELCGVFKGKRVGENLKNTENGIFGKIDFEPKTALMPVAIAEEVKLGKAKIISTVDENGPKYYDIKIEKIFIKEKNKNMVIKVTDKDLLEKTGGIVQGMSGSPIIQDGMLVGAVTHVFLNDPTGGYGIFIENMMDMK